MFLVNSRPGRFSAAPSSSSREGICRSGHPFSRSYGVILPSSLTRVHSSTLGFSPRLRVSVCGTVAPCTRIEVFLGSVIRASLRAKSSPHRTSGLTTTRICLGDPPTCLDRHYHPPADLSLLRHPIAQTRMKRFRNFNRIPIAYAFRPRLRGRLTLSGLSFLRKP